MNLSVDPFRVPRRTRTLSFTPVERRFIQDAVMANRHVLLEGTMTNGATARQRSKVWDDITKQFNQQPGFYNRDKKQLRKLWGNIRSNQRQAARYCIQTTPSDPGSDQSQDSIRVPSPYSLESGLSGGDMDVVNGYDIEEKPSQAELERVRRQYQRTGPIHPIIDMEDSIPCEQSNNQTTEEKAQIQQLTIQEYKEKVKLAQMKTKEQEDHMKFVQLKRKLELELLDEELKIKKMKAKALEKELNEKTGLTF
uniref:Regulatory protein zeste n=1 Tax=Cacopsylla melanoneura TaxID=428564 RepID=A0A8D9E364_9HEMI